MFVLGGVVDLIMEQYQVGNSDVQGTTPVGEGLYKGLKGLLTTTGLFIGIIK